MSLWGRALFCVLESALHGELKISRMSTVVGSAAGNEDLFMFVEKVDKSKPKKFEPSKAEQKLTLTLTRSLF